MSQQLVQQFQLHVEALQQILSTHHGMLRGTFEAALVEAQGAQFIMSNARTAQHVLSMEQGAAALIKHEVEITNALRQVAAQDPKTAGVLSRALQPLLQMARQRIDLVQQTRNLIFEIRFLHSNQLSGVPFQTAGRTVAGMASTQATSLRLGLVPGGIASHPWVQSALAQIRQLPMTATQATAQAAAAAATARAVLQSFLSRAAAGALLRSIGSGLMSLWNVVGSLISVMVIIVDQDGNPIGMPRHRNPNEPI